MTITIIGGGIIGLTTAFELTARGESVHLIDAEPSGYGTADAGTALSPAATTPAVCSHPSQKCNSSRMRSSRS